MIKDNGKRPEANRDRRQRFGGCLGWGERRHSLSESLSSRNETPPLGQGGVLGEGGGGNGRGEAAAARPFGNGWGDRADGRAAEDPGTRLHWTVPTLARERRRAPPRTAQRLKYLK